MSKFRVAVFIALCLSAATGSFIGDTLESVSYIALKKLMIAAGDSEFHANCFVEMLKATGTAKDVTEIMTNPDGFVEKIKQKAQFADFVCSPSGLIVAALLIGLALFACCGCFIQHCKCGTKKPIIFQMPSTHFVSRDASVPYTKMDIA